MNDKIESFNTNWREFPEVFDKNASVDEQNKFFRDLWSKHFGADRVNSFLSADKHLPRYESPNYLHQDKLQGKPVWDRLDVDLSELKVKDHMLAATVMSSTGVLDVVKSGSLLSAEQRLRALGDMKGSDDQSSGGSNSVFTRVYNTSKHSGLHFILHPRAMLRTDTRSFHHSDAFGNPSLNDKYIWSDPTKSWINNVTTSVGKTGKETDIEGSASLFGDLEIAVFDNAQQLNDAIQHLKKLGIEKIRGVPIEDRLVLRQNLTKAITELKKTWYD